MNSPFVRILGWSVLGLIVVLVALRLDALWFPCTPSNSPVAPEMNSKPVYHTLVIRPRAPGGMVEDVKTISRGRADYVRWVNCTDKQYSIVFLDPPDGHGWPLEPRDTIDVPAGGTSVTVKVARMPGSTGAVYYPYKSATNPLVPPGGPADPGMTVDD